VQDFDGLKLQCIAISTFPVAAAAAVVVENILIAVTISRMSGRTLYSVVKINTSMILTK